MSRQSNVYRIMLAICVRSCMGLVGLAALNACQTATFKEYHILPRYQGEEVGSLATVRYVTDPNERAAMKLYVRDGLLTDQNGDSLDPATDKFPDRDGLAIFVMDRQQQIYVSFDHVQNKFHHSSILAGQPVLAAGDMTIVQGKLLELTNSSGHYRPGPKTLELVMMRLKEMGVDMSEVKVVALHGSKKRSQK
ncbi:MAG: hypothetical protein CMH52_11980 [Myxococcales bacterium]|nr:hypothetical protein [Myxococcales bacterium]